MVFGPYYHHGGTAIPHNRRQSRAEKKTLARKTKNLLVCYTENTEGVRIPKLGHYWLKKCITQRSEVGNEGN